MKNIKILALLLAALFALGACGRKGEIIVPGTVLPEKVAGLAAEPAGDAVVLAWDIPKDNTRGEPLGDLAGFSVMRARLADGLDDCPCVYEAVGYVDLEYPGGHPGGAVIRADRVAWTDAGAGLAPGTTYAYRVAAVNSDDYPGKESDPIAVRLLTLPAAPTGVTAVPGDKSVLLGWDAVGTDAGGGAIPGPAGYNVYRAKEQGLYPEKPVNKEPVASPGYLDTGLANNKTYYYRVTALRGDFAPLTEGGPSAEVHAAPADTTPPSVPSGIRAVPGDGIVLVSWDPNVDAGLAGYVLYRMGPGDEKMRPLFTAPSPGITYEDRAVEPGASYTYAVTAVDDAEPPNESALSETASAALAKPPAGGAAVSP